MDKKLKTKKRKSTAIEKKKKIPEDENNVQSNSENDQEEDLLKNISNDAESTDDEGIDEIYGSDDNSSELSFESDEEGNYIRKKQVSDDESVEHDDEDGEDSDEEESEINAESDDSIENYDDTSDDSGEGDAETEKPVDTIKKSTKQDKVEVKEVETKQLSKMNKKVKEQIDKVEIKEVETSQLSKINKQGKENIDKVEIKDAEISKLSKKNKKKNALKKFEEKLNEDEKLLLNNKEEYENSDTSDEEDIRNTVGNIPMRWYDEYKHIGYDWDAKKIIKAPKGDQIDDFLRKIEDPNFWRTVKDPQTGQEVILTNDDIELIKRINSGRIPDDNYNDYENWIDWFTSEVEKMPIKNIPEHKRSFLPSSSEKKTVSKMVHALKMGWMKTVDEIKKEKKLKRGPKFYMLWETDTSRDNIRRIHDPVSAPKRDLPGHAESYNPPPEYILDDKEMKEWERMKDEPHRRKLHFLPQKYKSLREVPAYSRYLRERFLRCLDLYLCPRAKRMKLTIDAEYLIPKLPSPRDLQPFPTIESLIYNGHTDLVRSVSVEPHGEYIVSGSDDMTVKIWEISTGRCIRTIETGDIVRCVAWCPNSKLAIIAIASGNRLLLLNPKIGDKILVKKTDDLLLEAPKSDNIESDRIKTAVQWNAANEKEDKEKGIRIIITHFKPIHQVTWHGRGDYFATVMPEGANRSALIHQLSKRRTQIPFAKSKGLIQCVLFHPVKPCLFVATQHNIRIYDLVKQELLKKLLTNSKWISGMAIHPKGDNLLVSTYDKKMLWFDLDLSTKPYQTMRLHRNAVRSVAFHLRYPLFASASDDQAVIVSHGMVYNDLLQNPLIVPLKKLQTHEQRDEFGVLDVAWHPTQPWVFSTGADATIRLYT